MYKNYDIMSDLQLANEYNSALGYKQHTPIWNDPYNLQGGPSHLTNRNQLVGDLRLRDAAEQQRINDLNSRLNSINDPYNPLIK